MDEASLAFVWTFADGFVAKCKTLWRRSDVETGDGGVGGED